MHVLHEPSIDVLRHQLRHEICRHCHWRPCRSESLGPDVPRPCEARCSLFQRLPDLVRTARLVDPMLRPTQLTLRHRMLDLCRESAGARAACPLRRYQQYVAEILAKAFDR
jgi:hypothetical protein